MKLIEVVLFLITPIALLANTSNTKGETPTNGKLTALDKGITGQKRVATNPIGLLHQQWDDFFDNAPPGSECLQYAFNDGAIHVENALQSYNPERAKRISIVGIDPGGCFSFESCGSVRYYKNASVWRDPIPKLDPTAVTKGIETMFDAKSYPQASFSYHQFTSPAYAAPIKNNFDKYIRNNNKSL